MVFITHNRVVPSKPPTFREAIHRVAVLCGLLGATVMASLVRKTYGWACSAWMISQQCGGRQPMRHNAPRPSASIPGKVSGLSRGIFILVHNLVASQFGGMGEANAMTRTRTTKDLAERHKAESGFHDKKYGEGEGYPRHYAVNPTYPIYQRMMALAGDQSSRTVLEYGCGEGWITKDLALAGAKV